MYTYVHIYAIHTIIHVDIFVEEDHFANFVMARDHTVMVVRDQTLCW